MVLELRLPELQAVRSRPAHPLRLHAAWCRSPSSLIAVDPPTMLLSMFGTYALSAPRAVGRAAHAPPGARTAARVVSMSTAGARRRHVPAGTRHRRWVPRGERSQAPAAAATSPAAALAAATPAVRAAGAPAAELAARWEALRTQVPACTRCALHQTRTQGVFGVGPERVDWLVIGEAPGAEEDRRGEPFVGAAGQLLDAMLRAIGLDRKQQRLHRQRAQEPPAGQPRPEARGGGSLPAVPAGARSSCCARRLMLAVGRIAAQSLLGTDAPLGRLRGQVHRFGDTPLS